MGIVRLISTSALVTLMAACASKPSHATRAQQPAPAPVTVGVASEVPLLYVVDGVTQPLDRIPNVDPDQVASVRVLKGRTALLRYGPDAAYGVVIITTKRVAAHST